MEQLVLLPSSYKIIDLKVILRISDLALFFDAALEDIYSLIERTTKGRKLSLCKIVYSKEKPTKIILNSSEIFYTFMPSASPILTLQTFCTSQNILFSLS